MVAGRDCLGEKAVLHGGQEHFAGHRALIDNARLFKARHQRQAAHALVLKQVARAEANPRLPGAADHLDGDDRIATQLKEVVIQADLRHTEHIAPDGRQGFLQCVLRGDKRLLRGSLRQRQRFAVELAVGGHRQFGQGHEVRRHHVLRQTAEQPGLEVRGLFVLEYQVGHQLFTARHQHHRLTHRGMLDQACFNFAQLDTQAAQLDLMIKTAEVFDHPIGSLTHAVATAVKTLTVDERARHKTLGRQRRAAVITARQASATQVQLAGHTGGHRVELGVEHIGGEIGDRAADGHAVGTFVDTVPVGDVNGGFGGAIKVEQAGVWQLGEHLHLRIQRQGFATAHDTFEAGAGMYVWLVDKRLEHRRHKMHGGDAVTANGVDQARRFAMFARRSDDQARTRHQRPEEFPDRDVKAERGLLQDRVAGIQAIGLLHPAQAVDQAAMAVAGPLGFAGGAGGVDHVGQVERVAIHGGRFEAVALEPARRLVQGNHLEACSGQHRQQAVLAEQQRDAAVFDHVGEAFRRVFRVQRHVGATRLEDRKQAHHHFNGTLDANPHQHVRANPPLTQGMGQLVGAAVELGVGQRGGAKDQRWRVRSTLHLVFDQLMNTHVGRVRLSGLVPVMHQPVPLIAIQHRQLADTLFTVGHHGLQQADPVPGHARNGGCVEQVVRVGQRGVQGAGFFISVEGQVELRGTALPLHKCQLQAGSGTH
ncbi:hypothetical protein PFUM301597_00870 [Pseudomonas fluorescens]